MPDRKADLADVHEAILDMTRVTLAVSGKFASRSEAMRKLAELSIPPSRIAVILAVPVKDVTSVLAKAKKNGKDKGDNAAPSSEPTGE